MSLSRALTGQVQYVAYFADAMEGVARGDYIEETSRHANLHMVNSDTNEGYIRKLTKVKNVNDKAMLLLQNHLFIWATAELRPDYKEEVQRLYNVLKEANLLDTVVGAYLIDEPFWHDALVFEEHLKNPSKRASIGPDAVYRNLQLAAAAVKDVFGAQIITAASEAHTFVIKYDLPAAYPYSGYPGFPSNVDWLAVNCYYNYGAPCDTNEEYGELNQALVSKFTSNQRLFVTLDAYWPRDPSGEPGVEDHLINRVEYQMQIAQQFNAVAVVPFLYQSNTSHGTQFGIRTFPRLYSMVEELGYSITGKSRGAQFFCSKSEYACNDTIECTAIGRSERVQGCEAVSQQCRNLNESGSDGWFYQGDGIFKYSHVNSNNNTTDAIQNWFAKEDGISTGVKVINLKACKNATSGGTTKPLCGDQWMNKGTKWCSQNTTYQRICDCVPPGANDPTLWINEGNGCYSHKLEDGCANVVTTLPACQNWRATEIKSCEGTVIKGSVCGCFPEGGNDPNLWLKEANGCFSHKYLGVTGPVDGFSCTDTSTPARDCTQQVYTGKYRLSATCNGYGEPGRCSPTGGIWAPAEVIVDSCLMDILVPVRDDQRYWTINYCIPQMKSVCE